jgi:mono/diheme cytochrome c family protein
MKLSLLTLAASALALTLVVPQARARDAAAHGRALVTEFCSACHAVGRHDGSTVVGAPPLRSLSRSYDLDRFVDALRHGISSDHPEMPEFKFNRTDARDIQAYLRSIQR